MARSDEDLFIWFATFRRSRKVQQIEDEPEAHLTLGVTDAESAESYLQIQGKAVILTDAATKEANWNDHLGSIFSGPDVSGLFMEEGFKLLIPFPSQILSSNKA